MYVAGPQTYQINRQTNSFQIMCNNWPFGQENRFERTQARYIFPCVCTEIREKVIFGVKRFIPKNFQRENFRGWYSRNS